MAEVASLLVRVGADVSGFNQGMDEAAGRLKNAGKSMTAAGKKLSLGLTAPLTGVAAAITKVGIDFENQMAKVQAISGATGEDLKGLEATAKKLGATTEFSASQAAGGLEFLSRAGFSAQESMAALPSVLDLATASGMDLAQAADIASNIMGGFGIDAAEASRVTDILAKTAASANTNVAQLGDALKFAAPVANTLGMSMEETAAAIGIMSDAGIQAGMAGRTLRSMMTRLASGSGEAGDMMAMLGLEVKNASGDMLPMGEILDRIREKTAGMGEAQRAATLKALAGQQAISGLSVLLERGSADFANFTGELRNSEGAGEDMAQTMRDTLGGSLAELRSAAEAAALEFFNVLAPTLRKVVKVATDLARWFEGLSPTAKKLIVVVGGLAAALGPVLIVAGQITTAVSTLIPVITSLGSTLAVLSGPAGVILLVAAALATFIATNEDFRNSIIELATVIKEKAIKTLNWLKETYMEIKSAISTAGQDIIISVRETVESIYDLFFSRFNKVMETVSKWKDGIIGVFGNMKKALVGGSIVVDMVSGINQQFGVMEQKSTQDVDNMSTSILDTFTNMSSAVKFKVNGMIREGVDLFNKFQRDAVGAVGDLAAKAIARFTFLDERTVKKIGGMAVNILKRLGVFDIEWAKAWESIKNTALGIWNAIKNGIKRAVNMIMAPINSFKNAIKGAWGKIKGFLGIGSPDIITRTFLSIGESALMAAGRVDRAMTGMSRGIVPVTGLNQAGRPGAVSTSGRGASVINFTQNISAQARPEDITRITKRGLRQVARDWGVSDGRLL